jgi:hypothetical protein
MSTSCIIALYSKEDDEIVLLEKTHDGFLENIQELINQAKKNNYDDLEEIIEYLLKNTDVRFSIYSHKYPHQVFIYFVDTDKWKTIDIDAFKLNKICDCLENVKKAIR